MCSFTSYHAVVSVVYHLVFISHCAVMLILPDNGHTLLCLTGGSGDQEFTLRQSAPRKPLVKNGELSAFRAAAESAEDRFALWGVRVFSFKMRGNLIIFQSVHGSADPVLIRSVIPEAPVLYRLRAACTFT